MVKKLLPVERVGHKRQKDLQRRAGRRRGTNTKREAERSRGDSRRQGDEQRYQLDDERRRKPVSERK